MFAVEIAVLHRFAEGLALPRAWFSEPPKAAWSHYHVTFAKRAEAIEQGAVLTDHFMAREIALRQAGTWDAAAEARFNQERAKARALVEKRAVPWQDRQ
jgi:hypothetical protein